MATNTELDADVQHIINDTLEELEVIVEVVLEDANPETTVENYESVVSTVRPLVDQAIRDAYWMGKRDEFLQQRRRSDASTEVG